MMMRLVAVPAMVAGFLVLGGGTAHACKCVVREAAELVRDADVVFSGTVTDVRVDEPMLSGGRVTATLRADRVVKGPREAEFVVTTRAHSSACGYAFDQGTRYLVHAERKDGGLTTSLCSGNEVLATGDAGAAGEEPRATGDAGAAPEEKSATTRPGEEPQAGGSATALRTAAALAVLLVGAVLTWAFVRRRAR